LQPVTRIQQNILARSERRLLDWLCPRLPAWVKPDVLTAFGFFGALMTGFGTALAFYDRDWLWLGIAGYFVNWFGDSLDGSLARFRGKERPLFGYFIDHSTDALAMAVIAAGFGISPWVRTDVALVTLAAYYLLAIHTFLAARLVAEFRLSYLAAGPTEFRIALIALSLWMFATPPGDVALRLWGRENFSQFDVVLSILAIVLLCLFIGQTYSTARHLAERERQNRRERALADKS